MGREEKKRALTVEDLHFSYGAHEVLTGVTFHVRQGTVCGLLGPNGSGKSTLFRCCLNFLPPAQGRITVGGVDVRGLSPSGLARRVAYIPQEHRQPFPFTVRELVRMGRTPYVKFFWGLSGQDEARAEEAMERLGIAPLGELPCNRLSGGQRQLVLLARALAQDAGVLLLDEPTSALDFNNQLLVWRALRAIAAEGVSVLVSCHDPNHILWFCEQAVILDQGRVLADGEPGRVCVESHLQKLYGPGCRVGTASGLRVVYPREAV